MKRKLNMMNSKLIILIIILIFSFSLINAKFSNVHIKKSLNSEIEITLNTPNNLKVEIEVFEAQTSERIDQKESSPKTNHYLLLRGLTLNKDYILLLKTYDDSGRQIDHLNNLKFKFVSNYDYSNENEYEGYIEGELFLQNEEIIEEETNEVEENNEEPNNQEPNTNEVDQNENIIDPSSENNPDENIQTNENMILKNFNFISQINKINLTFETNHNSRIIITYKNEFSSPENKLVQNKVAYNYVLDQLLSGTKYEITIKACKMSDLNNCNEHIQNITTLSSSTNSNIQSDIKTNIKNGKVGQYLIINGTVDKNSIIKIYRNKNFNFALPEKLTQSTQLKINESGNVYGFYENTNDGPITYTILIENNGETKVIEYNAEINLEGPGLHITPIPGVVAPEFSLWGYVSKSSQIIYRVNNETINTSNENSVFNNVLSLGKYKTDEDRATIQIIAKDDYDNIEVEEFIAIIDDTAPEIQFDEDLKDIMSGNKEYHFPVLQLKGYAGEPNVRLYAVNFGNGQNSIAEFVVDARPTNPLAQIELKDGTFQEVIDKGMFDIAVKNLKGGNVAEDVIAKLKEHVDENRESFSHTDQISMYSMIDISLANSLKSLFTPIIDNNLNIYEVTADENGNFDFPIVMLQSGTEESDVHINNIGILAIDRVGNLKMFQYNVKYDPGEGAWTIGRKSKFPNSVYAMDWVETDMPVVLSYEFLYTGPGKNKIEDVAISVNKENNEFSDLWTIDSKRIRKKYDSNKGILKTEIPLKLNKLPPNTNVLDLPEGLDLEMEVTITSTLNDDVLSNDLKEQAAFGRGHIKQTVVIEIPETKWLNPKLVEKLIGVFDKVHKNLQKAIDVTKKVSVYTTALCGGLSFFSSLPFLGQTIDKSVLFGVCDRIACPYIPRNCQATNINEDGDTRTFSDEETGANVKYKFSDGSENCKPYGTDFNLIETESTYLNVDSNSDFRGGGLPLASGNIYSTQKTSYCLKMNQEEFASDSEGLFNVAPPGQNSCFSAGDPQYDDLKCLGDNNYFGEPASNLISSLRCGCVSGVLGNLQKYDNTIDAINSCLRQTQLGKFSGKYCEKLIAQSTCDILASAMRNVKNNQHKYGIPKIAGTTFRSTNPIGIIAQSKSSQKSIGEFFNDRYSNSAVSSKFTLGSQEMVHSLCIAAITGNYDDLTAFFESTVNINTPPQIMPIAGDSRIIYKSELAGEMDIKYTINSMIIGGGNTVEYKLQLQCDRNERGGEWCPQDRIELKTIAEGVINKNQRLDRGFVYVDQGAQWWYNKAVLEYKYNFNDKETVRSVSTGIMKRGDVSTQCNFNLHQGFDCITVDGFDVGTVRIIPSITEGLTIYPKNTNVIYPGDLLQGKISIEKINYNETDLWLNIKQKIPEDYIGPRISLMTEADILSINENAKRKKNTLMIPLIKKDGKPNLEKINDYTYIFPILKIPENTKAREEITFDKYQFFTKSQILDNNFKHSKLFQNSNDIEDSDLVKSITIKSTNLKIGKFSAFDKNKNEKQNANHIKNKELKIEFDNNKIQFANFVLNLENIVLVDSTKNLDLDFSINICKPVTIPPATPECKSYEISKNIDVSVETTQGYNSGELIFNITLAKNVNGGNIEFDDGDKPIIYSEDGREKVQNKIIRINLKDEPLSEDSCRTLKPELEIIKPIKNGYLCRDEDKKDNYNKIQAIIHHKCTSYFNANLDNYNFNIEVTLAGKNYISKDIKFILNTPNQNYDSSTGIITINKLFAEQFRESNSESYNKLNTIMNEINQNDLVNKDHYVKLKIKKKKNDNPEQWNKVTEKRQTWAFARNTNLCS